MSPLDYKDCEPFLESIEEVFGDENEDNYQHVVIIHFVKKGKKKKKKKKTQLWEPAVLYTVIQIPIVHRTVKAVHTRASSRRAIRNRQTNSFGKFRSGSHMHVGLGSSTNH